MPLKVRVLLVILLLLTVIVCVSPTVYRHIVVPRLQLGWTPLHRNDLKDTSKLEHPLLIAIESFAVDPIRSEFETVEFRSFVYKNGIGLRFARWNDLEPTSDITIEIHNLVQDHLGQDRDDLLRPRFVLFFPKTSEYFLVPKNGSPPEVIEAIRRNGQGFDKIEIADN